MKWEQGCPCLLPRSPTWFSSFQLGAREVGESAGSVGVCDPKANDHQWSVDIPAVAGDVTITEAHNAANTVDVCTTFTP